MLKTSRFILTAALLATAASFTQQVPIRRLGKPDAVSDAPVAARLNARQMKDGRVMLAEQVRPVQIVMLDANLAHRTVMTDSTLFTAGAFAGMLGITSIPYLGDSTLVADLNGNSLIVLDPNAKVARVLAMPRPTDARQITGPTAANAGLDARGRLIYRGLFPRIPSPAGATSAPIVTPDSFPIVGADFETRAVDTLATISVPSGVKLVTTITDNKITGKQIRQPLPTMDDWAVLSDGSIAIVRGHDFHVDWIYADGTHASTPKMDFDWRRVTDEVKNHLIDSLRTMDETQERFQDSIYAARGQKRPTTLAQHEYVPLSEIPDYYPPVRAGGVAADRDGNLWILPTTSSLAQGGLLYDVVNRKGDVFERVQFPPKCALAGFAPGGVVFTVCPGGGADSVKTFLNRTRIPH